MCHAHKIFVVLAATFALVTGATTVAEPVYEGHAGESTEVDGAKHVNERPVGARPASDRKYLDPNARTDRDWNGDAADPSDDFEPGKNEPNHRTIILFPGLASSRLRISRIGKKSACGGSLDDSLGGGIRGSVWANPALSAANPPCFLECITLNTGNYSDNACSVRPDEGLDAIAELAPGVISGELSSVFGHLINDLIAMGYVPHMELVAVPYDFRLPMFKLEQRDGYFMEIKSTIELAVKRRERSFRHKLWSRAVDAEPDEEGHGVIFVAHSLGNVIVRYFLDWLQNELGMNQYQQWVDDHIYMYFALNAALNGAEEAYNVILSGSTSGFPITLAAAHAIQTSWGSIPLQFVTGGNYTARNSRFTCARCRTGKPQKNADPQIDRADHAVVNITLPSGRVKLLTANDLLDPATWHGLGKHDPLLHRTAIHLQIHQYYAGIGRQFMFTDSLKQPWERPPIKRVVCAYGTGLKTPIGYAYNQHNASGFTLTHSRFEEEDEQYVIEHGKVRNTKVWSTRVEQDAGLRRTAAPSADYLYRRKATSGDGTVPYDSLSWCHNWLRDGEITVTTVPQDKYNLHEFAQRNMDRGGSKSEDTKSETGQGNVNVFYEEGHIDTAGRAVTTAVWELDKQEHRDILIGDVFRREFQAELESMLRAQKARQFQYRKIREHMFNERHNVARKRMLAHRPKVDADCYWDYYNVECKPLLYCLYAYRFGDIHLSQSCRLNVTHTEIVNAERLSNSGKKKYSLGVSDLQSDAVENPGADTKGLDTILAGASVSVDSEMCKTDSSQVSYGPQKDADCYFDYHEAQCMPAPECIYKYKFGDYALSHSCRLSDIGRRRVKAQQELRDKEIANGVCTSKEDCSAHATSKISEILEAATTTQETCTEQEVVDLTRACTATTHRVRHCLRQRPAHKNAQQHQCDCVTASQEFQECMGRCWTVARDILCVRPVAAHPPG
eukprot:m.165398 g.165398  ORF g.165398 m.165398 type:complete len:955 (+) comp18138_c0_seq3:309-3173(+)